MINISEVIETNKMIEKENFDVRTMRSGRTTAARSLISGFP